MASRSDRNDWAEKIRQTIIDAQRAGISVLFVRDDEGVELVAYAASDSSFGAVIYSEIEEN